VPEDQPKLFISYSWSSPEHEEWVIDLATELRESGVDVILDKWDLKEGHDAHAFMEKMVTDPDIKKVAIICDKAYSDKADGRSGGVGTETQIITPEVYNEQAQTKFVAVLKERDDRGMPYLPVYYRSRIYIDLSSDELHTTNFEQLLRWVYDKPLYVKPDLGQKPAFLSDSLTISLGSSAKFKRAVDAIRANKDYATGAMNEYFETVVHNLEKFRITEKTGEFDDQVVENIDLFIPYRNEVIELFLVIAQYRDNRESMSQLHRFFESLIPYMYPPEEVRSYSNNDYDNFKFVIHELFIYCIACLLKYERFEFVKYMFEQHFFVSRNADYGRDSMVSFTIFRHHLKSLELRNQRLELRRLSVRSDLLEQRSKSSGIPFRLLMQADFIIFLRDCFDSLRENGRQNWWPETLLYVERYSGAFEIFARCQSAGYLRSVGIVFGILEKKEFDPVLAGFNDKSLYTPKWEFDTIDPVALLGCEKLGIRP